LKDRIDGKDNHILKYIFQPNCYWIYDLKFLGSSGASYLYLML